MKRKIAAVLMADAAAFPRLLAEDAAGARVRLAAHHETIQTVVRRSGGRIVKVLGEAVVAEFTSAVDAVRAAIEMQESLRARSRDVPLPQKLEFKVGITIGEVGESDVAGDTLAVASRLVSLAAPGGLCVSRSVREAILSKLKLKFQDMTAEGAPPAGEPPSPYRVATDQPAAVTASPLAFGLKLPRFSLPALAALFLIAAGGYLLFEGTGHKAATTVADVREVLERPAQASSPSTAPPASDAKPQAPDAKPSADAEKSTKPPSGVIEFRPALTAPKSDPEKAPSPASVLTAARMMPNAWKDCHEGNAEAALAGCKTLLDSGIPKDGELADIHIQYGKALRERNELAKAVESFTAAIAAKPLAEAYSQRGTVYYDMSKWDRAIADYTDALRLNPKHGESFNNRAWTYYRTGRVAEALADADAAVRLLGKEAYVWDTRGHINAALGNRDAAIRDFRAALAIDPKYADSRDGLAKLGVN